MEYKGVRKLIPAAMVGRAKAGGAIIVADDGAPISTSAPVKAPATKEERRAAMVEAARESAVLLDKADIVDNMSAGDKVGAFTQGAADTMSLGLADEGRGFLEALGQAPQRLLQGNPGAIADDYVAGRDAQREAQATTQEFAPMAYGAGTVAGAIPTAVGGLGAKAAQAATSITGAATQAAKVGAATGAVQGFGSGKGLEGSSKEALRAGIFGALLGGGLGGGAKALDPAARAAAKQALGDSLGKMKTATAGVKDGAVPLLRRFAENADKMHPIARLSANLVTGGGFTHVVDVAKTVVKFMPAAADDMARVVDDVAAGKPVPEWVTRFADEIGELGDDASGLALARAPRSKMKLDAPVEDATGLPVGAQPPSPVRFLSPVEDAAAAKSSPVRFLAPVDDAAPVSRPTPAAEPAPAPVATMVDDVAPVARTKPRNLNDDSAAMLIRKTAIEHGTQDAATIASKAGLPSSQVTRVLPRLVKSYDFRSAVEAAAAKAKPAVQAPAPGTARAPADVADDATNRLMRDAAAKSRDQLAVDPGGRQAAQVAATKQASEWRAVYDKLPAEKRGGFIAQLLRNNPPEKVRKRLGLTKGEWARLSFSRAGAQELR